MTGSPKKQIQRIGELNGPWAAWFKIQIALVPMLFMAMLGGGVFQITHNTRVDEFMQRKETYTPTQAIQDHVALRTEFDARYTALQESIDALRIAMQQATPEADRRLKLMEQTLTAIQADIVSMRISLAQIRISGSPPISENLKP
jgi:hypothetical protein